MSEAPSPTGPFSNHGVLARFLGAVYAIVDKTPSAAWAGGTGMS